MAKQNFFVKLIPPRASFPGDITPEEMATMKRHADYYAAHFQAGRVLIYGPVMAAGGAYGMGVVDVESEAEARTLVEADPSITEGLNRYELWPMRLGGAQASR
ncbi:MAG TPA: YciI family protein [Acidobacteriaceae bacterium]|jgi:uncharacterized protein YciI|nr:YciI family protein [Acidobacteriaceae bacterium]